MYSSRTFEHRVDQNVVRALRFIRDNKKRTILLVCIFYLLFDQTYRAVNSFEAEAQIMFDDYLLPDVQKLPGANGVEDIFNRSVSLNRVNGIVNSDKMLKYLADKYNLPEHYGYERSNLRHMNCFYNKLDKNIRFGLINFPGNTNRIFIRVSDDEDPVLAANIANDIAAKIQEENRQYILSAMERKQQLNKNAAEQLYAKYNKLVQDLNVLLSEFKEIQRPSGIKESNKYDNIYTRITETIINLNVQAEALKDFETMSNVSSVAQKEVALPEVQIVKPAMVDVMGTNIPYPAFIPIALLGAALSTYLSILLYQHFHDIWKKVIRE